MPGYVPLPGSMRTLLPFSRPAGPVDRSTIETLTVRLRSTGNCKHLEQRVYQESLKPLAQRTYLSRADLAKTHGADPADLDLVERFAQEHNLAVAHRSAAQRSIVLKGTLRDLLNVFPANLDMYHHSRGTYRGRRGEISIPKELEGVVTGIFGFDTRPRHRSLHRGGMLAASGSTAPTAVPATVFAQRYNFPTKYEGVKLDGTGQTIAIIELGGSFRSSDLKTYFQEIGVPLPAVSAISVDHAGNHPSQKNEADGEVMLDIEVAGAVVPKANFAVYFAPNNGDKGFIDAISAAIYDPERKVDVISISWGGVESNTDQQAIDAFHELFVTAAAAGITVCAASGDHGTACLDAQHWDQKIHVDHPAADDFVLACGGTQIENGQDVVWNDGTPFDVNVQGGGGWATGGGDSKVFPVPYYQTAINPQSIDGGGHGRGVPDIAMSATGYFTRVDSIDEISGGTSAVAPLMSALVALLNQAKQKNVGFLNPFLYARAGTGILNDVTQGTSAIKHTVAGYPAQPGWDACTGLGTPDGAAILNSL